MDIKAKSDTNIVKIILQQQSLLSETWVFLFICLSIFLSLFLIPSHLIDKFGARISLT